MGVLVACLAILCQPAHGDVAQRIAEGARQELAWGTTYDPSYVRLPYPNGDIPRSKGVCTDVVIRALRMVGYDLQRLIHEDVKAHPGAYPNIHKIDSNIDHRRVPNQARFFSRHGLSVSLRAPRASWRPGDFVWWKLPNGLDHTGVLSSRYGRSGVPMVVHNLSTTAEEDCLFSWKIVGHYRYPVR